MEGNLPWSHQGCWENSNSCWLLSVVFRPFFCVPEQRRWWIWQRTGWSTTHRARESAAGAWPYVHSHVSFWLWNSHVIHFSVYKKRCPFVGKSTQSGKHHRVELCTRTEEIAVFFFVLTQSVTIIWSSDDLQVTWWSLSWNPVMTRKKAAASRALVTSCAYLRMHLLLTTCGLVQYHILPVQILENKFSHVSRILIVSRHQKQNLSCWCMLSCNSMLGGLWRVSILVFENQLQDFVDVASLNANLDIGWMDGPCPSLCQKSNVEIH